jgi:hypothetical protein
MALSFRFNLVVVWIGGTPNRLTQDLKVDKDEAMIVAVAEIADALRHIAHKLTESTGLHKAALN